MRPPSSPAASEAPQKINVTESYPIELHYIKILFTQNQYRQCIQACRDIIQLAGDSLDGRPLQKTFVNFYLGLAHDEIARLMHANSVAKNPAFTSAEQHYLDAINSLPAQETARALYIHHVHARDDEDPSNQSEDRESLPSPCTPAPRDSFDLLPSSATSPSTMSPPHFRRGTLPFRSPIPTPKTLASDFDDLESNDSFCTPTRNLRSTASTMPLFDATRTPQKGLPRDFSSMSLIDPPRQMEENDAPERWQIPREFSKMSLLDQASPRKPQRAFSGPMLPFQPGPPAKHYTLPPRLSGSGTAAELRSKLPPLSTRTRTAPQLGKFVPQQTASPISISPVSPVSQSGFDMDDPPSYNVSPVVSPISLDTPSLDPWSSTDDLSKQQSNEIDESAFLRFTDHLQELRMQLETHLMLVQQAKQNLLHAQAEKKTSRPGPMAGTPNDTTPRKKAQGIPIQPTEAATTGEAARQLRKARSYWSFVPEQVKEAEKKRRIRERRAQEWERKRFDPTRYQELCEKALAEL